MVPDPRVVKPGGAHADDAFVSDTAGVTDGDQADPALAAHLTAGAAASALRNMKRISMKCMRRCLLTDGDDACPPQLHGPSYTAKRSRSHLPRQNRVFHPNPADQMMMPASVADRYEASVPHRRA